MAHVRADDDSFFLSTHGRIAVTRASRWGCRRRQGRARLGGAERETMSLGHR